MNIEEIRNIVLAKYRDAIIPRKRAIGMLLLSNYPTKHQDFESLLTNRQESQWVRYQAALCLGKINTSEAEEILLENIQIKDEIILAGIMTSLAAIGDKRSLEAILNIKEPLTGLALTRARLAKSLISYRLGLDGNEFPVPDEKDYLKVPNYFQSIIFTEVGEEQVKKCCRSIGDRPYGIEPSQSQAYELLLQNDAYVVILDKQFIFQGVEKLLERKALLGVIAKADKRRNTYFVSYLILTSCSEERKTIIEILVVRPLGKVCFGGIARVSRSNAKFSIRSISQPGIFPVFIEGIIADNKLKLTNSYFSPIIPKQNQPMEIKRI